MAFDTNLIDQHQFVCLEWWQEALIWVWAQHVWVSLQDEDLRRVCSAGSLTRPLPRSHTAPCSLCAISRLKCRTGLFCSNGQCLLWYSWSCGCDRSSQRACCRKSRIPGKWNAWKTCWHCCAGFAMHILHDAHCQVSLHVYVTFPARICDIPLVYTLILSLGQKWEQVMWQTHKPALQQICLRTILQ